jgi:hypothetical protein
MRRRWPPHPRFAGVVVALGPSAGRAIELSAGELVTPAPYSANVRSVYHRIRRRQLVGLWIPQGLC